MTERATGAVLHHVAYHRGEHARQVLASTSAEDIRYGCSVHAYVLMTNHVHLLVIPSSAGAVSRMLQWLGRQYVGYINGRYRRTGTLWEGRCKSCLVDTERYLLTCYRHIELNPAWAAMVADPVDYAWSSYRANAQALPDTVVAPQAEYLRLGADVSNAALPTGNCSRKYWAMIAWPRFVRTCNSNGRWARLDSSAIEAMIGRCANIRPAHRPRRNKDDFGRGSDPL